jgi:hypothetical protein
MAVTAAPHGRVPVCVDVEQGNIYRQVSAGIELNLLCVSQIQACGTHLLAS